MNMPASALYPFELDAQGALVGWDARALAFLRGQRTWPKPPGASRTTVPWPFQWTLTGEPDPVDAAQVAQGFGPARALCTETGKWVDMKTGCRCARCGAPLAFGVAGITPACDVPSCYSCRPALRTLVLESLLPPEAPRA